MVQRSRKRGAVHHFPLCFQGLMLNSYRDKLSSLNIFAFRSMVPYNLTAGQSNLEERTPFSFTLKVKSSGPPPKIGNELRDYRASHQRR